MDNDIPRSGAVRPAGDRAATPAYDGRVALTPIVQPSVIPLAQFARPRPTERRRAIRYNCTLETSANLIAQVQGDTTLAKVRNISVTGISLILPRRLEAETVVELELFNKARQYYCRVPLRVVYVMEHLDGNFLVGGAFGRELSNEELNGLL